MVRVIRDADCSELGVLGSADGSCVARGALTVAVARCGELDCGANAVSVTLGRPEVVLGVAMSA